MPCRDKPASITCPLLKSAKRFISYFYSEEKDAKAYFKHDEATALCGDSTNVIFPSRALRLVLTHGPLVAQPCEVAFQEKRTFFSNKYSKLLLEVTKTTTPELWSCPQNSPHGAFIKCSSASKSGLKHVRIECALCFSAWLKTSDFYLKWN